MFGTSNLLLSFAQRWEAPSPWGYIMCGHRSSSNLFLSSNVDRIGPLPFHCPELQIWPLVMEYHLSIQPSSSSNLLPWPVPCIEPKEWTFCMLSMVMIVDLLQNQFAGWRYLEWLFACVSTVFCSWRTCLYIVLWHRSSIESNWVVCRVSRRRRTWDPSRSATLVWKENIISIDHMLILFYADFDVDLPAIAARTHRHPKTK